MSVTIYTFADADGNEFGSFRTFDFKAAEEYAQLHEMKLIANEYEFSDSEIVADYTPDDDDDDDVDSDIDDDDDFDDDEAATAVAGPAEDDYMTADYVRWYQSGRLVLTTAGADTATPADDWAARLVAHQHAAGFYPDAWFISDHGNARRIVIDETADGVRVRT